MTKAPDPRPLARRLSAVIVLACLGALLAGATATPAAAPSRAFVGHAKGGGSIEFTIRWHHGRPQSGQFTAEDLKLSCEDGSTMRFSPISAPEHVGFHDSRSEFDGRRYYSTDSGAASEYYYRIHGRLLGKNRARGFVFLYLNPFDPPDGSNGPECTTTGGQQTWKASR